MSGAGLPKPAHHGRDHRLGGEDPIPNLLIPPTWQDIRGSVTVTRVSGGDSDPDITVSLAEEITVGEIVGGLTIIQLVLVIGSGGAGSGTSGYVLGGLGGGFGSTNYMAGTGVFFQASPTANNRCSIRSAAGSALLLQWDGAAGMTPLGPKASSGGGPFDFAAGDTLFDGQLIVPTF